MAKPINPYQGEAPRAMAQMGQGILEAGANIARTIQGGYESMGKGLAGGITAAADAYKQYKEDEAKFNATKKMYKAFGGSLDETQRKEIDGIFADTSMSVRDKNALAPALMQYLGASQQQNQALAKQKAELDAAAARQAAQIAGNQMQPYYDKSASLLMSPTGSSMKGAGYGGGRAPGGGVSLQDEEPFQFGKFHL
jgi:hypothetical protein